MVVVGNLEKRRYHTHAKDCNRRLHIGTLCTHKKNNETTNTVTTISTTTTAILPFAC